MQTVSYRGKRFVMPEFSVENGIVFVPHTGENAIPVHREARVIRDIGKPFDLARFKDPRLPVSLGLLPRTERADFVRPVPRVLDMPIKLAGNPEYRLPVELAQFAPLIRRLAAYEADANPTWVDYYAYLTIDQGTTRAGELLREAPCHVDGFQGGRWVPKHPGNHTYTVSNVLSTAYYPMPFDFDGLDPDVHDYFWEMNYQVARANSAVRWASRDWEVTLMDCYCVHRGREATADEQRTWLRLSFETRVFDRLGNGHNPLFDYAWEMRPRDIEELGLVAFHAECDPSLRVFPWQDLDGRPLPAGAPKTKPNLMPFGRGYVPEAWRGFRRLPI